jgi:hypothetical protein
LVPRRVCSSVSLFFILTPYSANLLYLQTIGLGTSYSLTTVFIGYTDGCTSRSATNTCISPITNGSVCHSTPLFSFRALKFHSQSKVPTPFVSHAFHPVDGFFQSLPYHFFIFVFPIHRILYLILFVLANFWNIFVSS